MLRVVVFVAGLILIDAGAAHAQGFFEYFFGGLQMQQPQRSYIPPRAPPPIAYVQPAPLPKMQLNPYTDGLGAGQELSSKPEKVSPPPVGKGPLGPFLFDPTLQAGDVVVTTQGLYVYRGRGGLEHRIGDFIPLAHASVKTPQLVAIDKVARRGKPPVR